MSITLKYQSVADETTGDRILQGAEPVIDDVLRATSLSAVAAFSPPLKFVTSIFIGNYRDEFKRGRHYAEYIVYLTATAKTDSRNPNKFQADLWCEFIYSDHRSIASVFSGVPAGSIPANLKAGEIRFDWLPEDAYVEIAFAIAQDQMAESFEAACRSVDHILATKWDAAEPLIRGKIATTHRPRASRSAAGRRGAKKDGPGFRSGAIRAAAT